MRPEDVPRRPRGAIADHARNQAFLRAWDAAPRGEGKREIARRFGYKNWRSAAVVACRIRSHGTASTWPAIPGHGKSGVRQ
jgi:hypothetical protein